MGAELLGGILLIACALSWGILRANALSRQQQAAHGFLALLRHIRAQIDGYSMPADAIFASLDRGMLNACGLETGQPTDLAELLAAVGDKLAPDARALLEGFSRKLGTSLRTEQLRLCENTITQLDALLAAARADAPRQRRLWLLLPPIAAGALWVLLL